MSDDPIDIASYSAAPFTGGFSLLIPAARSAMKGMSPNIQMPDAPPPPVDTAVEMPDPGDPLAKKRRQREAAAAMTSGRTATLLSEAAAGTQKLGG